MIDTTMDPRCRALTILIERPGNAGLYAGANDFLYVSRERDEITIEVTTECDGTTAIIPYPITPDDARTIAQELWRLANEIDGRG